MATYQSLSSLLFEIWVITDHFLFLLIFCPVVGILTPDASVSFTTYSIISENPLWGSSSLASPLNILIPHYLGLGPSHSVSSPTAMPFTSMALITKYILLRSKDIIYSPGLCYDAWTYPQAPQNQQIFFFFF